MADGIQKFGSLQRDSRLRVKLSIAERALAKSAIRDLHFKTPEMQVPLQLSKLFQDGVHW